ncbi:MAG: hypothetical protein KatS3mg105_4131 [Gemmatales bacterium]|nr:MAG: hypothetical protein KatS3mg105_4131 [Gemmatales bacterium]
MKTLARWICRLLAVVAVVAALPADADAAWFGLRNDTKTPLLIQVLPGRPTILYPGDVAWDAIIRPGTRLLSVYDPRAPQRPIYQGKVNCGAANQFFSIRLSGPGRIVFVPTRPSKLPRQP